MRVNLSRNSVSAMSADLRRVENILTFNARASVARAKAIVRVQGSLDSLTPVAYDVSEMALHVLAYNMNRVAKRYLAGLGLISAVAGFHNCVTTNHDGASSRLNACY
jgi:hypothetical protein